MQAYQSHELNTTQTHFQGLDYFKSKEKQPKHFRNLYSTAVALSNDVSSFQGKKKSPCIILVLQTNEESFEEIGVNWYFSLGNFYTKRTGVPCRTYSGLKRRIWYLLRVFSLRRPTAGVFVVPFTVLSRKYHDRRYLTIS